MPEEVLEKVLHKFQLYQIPPVKHGGKIFQERMTRANMKLLPLLRPWGGGGTSLETKHELTTTPCLFLHNQT